MHTAFWALAALIALGAVVVGLLLGRPVPPTEGPDALAHQLPTNRRPQWIAAATD